MKQIIISMFVAVLTAGQLFAAEYQPHDTIKDAVKHFLIDSNGGDNTTTRVRVGKLDRRLRLHRCAQPLEVFALPNAKLIGATTVGVRCEGVKPWKLFVRARVEKLDLVLVSRRPLSRGMKLAADDLKQVEYDVARISGGYVTDGSRVVGKLLKRSVTGGTVISPNMLESPKVVQRGEKVAIMATAKGLSVKMYGRALEDGAEGELIRVRNNSSRREIDAVVVASGVVSVTR